MVLIISRRNKRNVFAGVDMGIPDRGVGDKKKPTQNMAPWHIIYFKLKEFQKTEAGRAL